MAIRTQIEKTQYFCILSNLLFTKAIGFTTGIFARSIGLDTWISMLIGFTVGMILLFIMTFLGSKFPEKTIISYSETILGKFGSKLLGVILFVFFSISFMASANVTTLHLNQYMLPETPLYVLTFAYTLLCIYGVWLGIEVIARFSLFGLLGTVLITFLMVLGTLDKFDTKQLLPFLDHGIYSNISTSLYSFSDSAIVIFCVAMIYPMLTTKKKTFKLTFWGMLFSIFLTIIWPIFELGVLGADVMKQYVIVCMQQARAAQFSFYLPRYELIMVILFIWGGMVQSMLLMFCGFYSFKQISGVNKNRYILLPMFIILFSGTTFLGNDPNRFIQFLVTPWSIICLILCIIIPLLLLVIALIQKKIF